ncbi:MAG: ribonuclease H-like domain-containing protein [Clostridiales bacterium]|nr:ribonuclease H-like domain-containing protein [Clostridiales bacterium]
MIHRKNRFPVNSLPPFQQHFLTEEMLLFDIETTGLSAARDFIYCIGCGYRTDDTVRTELFFAETPAQEEEILAAFSALLNRFTTLITFNGTTFDIPFIRKRSTLYDKLSARKYLNLQQEPHLTKTTDRETPVASGSAFIDLYREAIRMKSLLRLPSYRQKVIEQFLGCTREDKYDGGQLIRIYRRYVSVPDPQALSLLLLHNEEDVRGLFDLIGLLSWHQLRDGAFAITDSFEERNETDSFYNIKVCPDISFPQAIGPITIKPEHPAVQHCPCLLGKKSVLICFPIYHGTLKHFFPDPENYVYLPEEGCAVHKSVGAFVDPAHRRKATRQNCYSRQDCDYISIPVKTADGFLKKEFRDECCYLALPAQKKDEKTFLIHYFSLFFQG